MSDKEQIEEMAKVLKDYTKENHIMASHTILENYAEALYNAGYRKQEWISVDDRLPENLSYIIVCDKYGNVGEAYCYGEGWFEWIDSEERVFVTHWMPLPEPPKGV